MLTNTRGGCQELLLNSRREPLTDTVTESTWRRIEPRTSRHSAFVCDWRHGRHTLVVVFATLNAFCVTVATSCELVAIVDCDGQGINSAGARTPHEPLSSVLMSATWALATWALAAPAAFCHRMHPPWVTGGAGAALARAGCCRALVAVHRLSLLLLL